MKLNIMIGLLKLKETNTYPLQNIFIHGTHHKKDLSLNKKNIEIQAADGFWNRTSFNDQVMCKYIFKFN